MENQPNPLNFATPRHCENCAFAIEGHIDPNSLKKQFRCAWGPPQMILIPTPQGLQLNVMQPPVDASMICHQHRLKTEISNAKNSPENEPAN